MLGDLLKPIIVQDYNLALLTLLALHMPQLCLARQRWTACGGGLHAEVDCMLNNSFITRTAQQPRLILFLSPCT